MYKSLSTDITLVTELKVQLVDRYTRNRLKLESNSVKIPNTVSVNNTDIVITELSPYIIQNISAIICITSWDKFNLRLTYNDLSVSNIPCTGTFLLYGALQEVLISSTSTTPIRVSVISA